MTLLKSSQGALALFADEAEKRLETHSCIERLFEIAHVLVLFCVRQHN